MRHARWFIVLLVFVALRLSTFPGANAREARNSWNSRNYLGNSRNYLNLPLSLVVPVGEVRRLHVSGRYSENLRIQIEDPRVCDLVPDKIPVMLRGLHPGTTRVEIRSGQLVKTAGVTVIDRAGFIPKEASLVVTGDRVSGNFLRAELKKTLDELIVRKEGTKIQVKLLKDSFPSNLEPGEGLKLRIRVKVWGGKYIPSQGVLMLSVKNEPVTLHSVSHLMVSNNPESFSHPETLFKEEFPSDSPVRFFYHHVNKGDVPYIFEVCLRNTDDRSTSVHVLEGTAGADPRELSVGASAAERYFSALKHRLGKIIKVNPESDYLVIRTKVEPGGVVSGILRFNPLDGSRPIVIARAREADVNNEQESGDNTILQQGNKSSGIFESPEIAVDSEYSVGGDYAFITIGKDFLLRDLITAKPDLGNYGALYTIHLALKNPTHSPAIVHVMFAPEAGPARGIFLMNGQTLVKTPAVSAFRPYPLLKVNLKPGETRRVEIQTIPGGGSFYPVMIIAQP